MRRAIALVLVVALVATVMALATPAPAHAGAATNVALGLASFAVFNQLVGGLFYPRPVYAYPAPVYYGAPAYYVERPVYYAAPAYAAPAAPAPTYPRVVRYPHGRYELRGDGIYTAYQWVWIPNPPPPPPPPAAPPTR